MTRYTNLINVAALLCLVALGGCVAVVAGGTAAGGYLIGRDERTIEQIAKDAQTTARVKSALIRNKEIRALDINVDTYVGVVSLLGQVKNPHEQELATSIASATEGVKLVKSELKVIPVEIEDISQ